MFDEIDIEDCLQPLFGMSRVGALGRLAVEIEHHEFEARFYRRKNPTLSRQLKQAAIDLAGLRQLLKHGVCPSNVSDATFVKYRPLCEALVSRQELAPETLDCFPVSNASYESRPG